MTKKALLLIDIQNSFCPGGNLPVPGGDEIIPVVNALMEKGGYDLIVASQDWHPAGHGSFASSHPGKKPFEMGILSGNPQMMWPDHCVQGTKDAEFHPLLKKELIGHVQRKGMKHDVDSYSAFRDNDRKSRTGLDEYLKKTGVTELHICGLATDYCVKFSALDAKAMLPGVRVIFIGDASRGITPAGVMAACKEMTKAGIETRKSGDIIKAAPPKPPRKKSAHRP